MRRAVLILAASICAVGGPAACRTRGTLDPAGSAGAGGRSSTGAAGASGAGGQPPAGDAGGGGATPSGPGGTAGVIAGGAGAPGGAGGGTALACPGGAVFTYLVRSLSTYAPVPGDGAWSVHGFDLDGRASDGSAPEDCHVPDGTAPDGRTGIDNTIAGLWGEDFAPLFNVSYAAGVSPIIVRLSGVDDFDRDDCVDVEWSEGQWVGPPVDPASPQAAGQKLRQAESIALVRGGRLEGGRLLADVDATVTLFAQYDATDARLRLVLPLGLSRISFAATAEGLTRGELGGHVDPEDIYRAYQSIVGSFITREQVATVLRPDLPSGQSPCALLSAGYGFEAVPVTIVP